MDDFCKTLGETNTFQYDGQNQMTEQLNHNGTKIEHDWNHARRWPLSITHKQGVTPFASYSVEYDSLQNTVGNLTKTTELTGTTVTYGYDDLYRLTAETRVGDNSYGGRRGGRLTWDDRSHGAGVDRGEGPQGGHWDNETSGSRWNDKGELLPGSCRNLTWFDNLKENWDRFNREMDRLVNQAYRRKAKGGSIFIPSPFPIPGFPLRGLP